MVNVGLQMNPLTWLEEPLVDAGFDAGADLEAAGAAAGAGVDAGLLADFRPPPDPLSPPPPPPLRPPPDLICDLSLAPT